MLQIPIYMCHLDHDQASDTILDLQVRKWVSRKVR